MHGDAPAEVTRHPASAAQHMHPVVTPASMPSLQRTSSSPALVKGVSGSWPQRARLWPHLAALALLLAVAAECRFMMAAPGTLSSEHQPSAGRQLQLPWPLTPHVARQEGFTPAAGANISLAALQSVIDTGRQATVHATAGASNSRRPSSNPTNSLRIDDMRGMVTPKGYALEQYEVVTQDGYKLGTFRIPRPGGPPVLLLHGISLCSTCWVLNNPDQSLAFILADAGYDVWMMNTRGNTFARTHEKLRDTQSKFWAFSMDQMALYDLTATVDYVLAQTGRDTLSFLGHSQAGSIALAALSYYPDLGKKFNVALLVAPCVYVKYMTSPILDSYCAQANSTPLAFAAPPSELYPMSRLAQSTYMGGVCQLLATMPECLLTLQGMFGTSSHISLSQYRRYWTAWPSPTSTWNGLHWAQIFNEPEPSFRMFNYGPEYDLTKVNAKVVIFSGGRDVLAAPKDVAMTKQRLREAGALVGEYHIPDYSHMDWIWDTNARTRAYPHFLAVLRRYSRGEGDGGAAMFASHLVGPRAGELLEDIRGVFGFDGAPDTAAVANATAVHSAPSILLPDGQ